MCVPRRSFGKNVRSEYITMCPYLVTRGFCNTGARFSHSAYLWKTLKIFHIPVFSQTLRHPPFVKSYPWYLANMCSWRNEVNEEIGRPASSQVSARFQQDDNVAQLKQDR